MREDVKEGVLLDSLQQKILSPECQTRNVGVGVTNLRYSFACLRLFKKEIGTMYFIIENCIKFICSSSSYIYLATKYLFCFSKHIFHPKETIAAYVFCALCCHRRELLNLV
jgi:hypothetical protein